MHTEQCFPLNITNLVIFNGKLELFYIMRGPRFENSLAKSKILGKFLIFAGVKH